LFAVFGSVDELLTVGTTTIENPPGLGAFHTKVMFGALAPDAMLAARVQVIVVVGAGHTQPEPTALKNVPLPGSWITTLTPVAVSGPALATGIV
jgi:hypothetical protein